MKRILMTCFCAAALCLGVTGCITTKSCCGGCGGGEAKEAAACPAGCAKACCAKS